jgi:hypothetical protein
MIKYQETPDPNNTGAGGPRRSLGVVWDAFRYKYIVLIVGLALLLGLVAYTTYRLGESRGIELGNADRDSFYKQRIAELTNYGATPGAALTPNISTNPGASSTVTSTAVGAVLSNGQGTLARVDSIQGDVMHVLLLNKDGTPSGVTLNISLSQQPIVWRSDRTDVAVLAPGQNIMFIGQSASSNGTYNVKGVLILPLSDS